MKYLIILFICIFMGCASIRPTNDYMPIEDDSAGAGLCFFVGTVGLEVGATWLAIVGYGATAYTIWKIKIKEADGMVYKKY